MQFAFSLDTLARQFLPASVYLQLRVYAIRKHKQARMSTNKNMLDRLVRFLVIKFYKTGRMQTIYALERIVRRVLPTRLYLKIRQRAMIHLSTHRRSAPPLPRADAMATLSPAKKPNPPVPDMKKIEESLVTAPSASILQGGRRSRVKYDIVICVAFLQRHDILRLVIDNLQDAPLSLAWVLVGSSKEDLAFLKSLGRVHDNVFGLQCQNNPLGKKWRFAVHAAEQLCRFDLMGITGSDDVLASKLVENVHRQYTRDREFKKTNLGGAPALYAVQHWHMLDLNRQSAHFGAVFRIAYRDETAWMPIGAGRFYTEDFIREFSDDIFDENKERLLDDDGFHKIVEQGEPIAMVEDADYTFLSIKHGEDELNAFEVILTANTIHAVDCSLSKSRILENFSAILPLKGITSNDRLKALVG